MTSGQPRFTLHEHRASPFCVAARIALRECAAPFLARPVDLASARQQAQLKRSPFGHLPTLVEHRPGGELSVFESPAILLFLADSFPASGLAPQGAENRAEATAWLFSLAACFTVDLWQVLLEDHVHDASARSPKLQARARSRLELHLEVLDDSVARRPFLAGAYSLADACATPHLDLLERLGVDLDALPRVRAWRARCRERPSYRDAWAQESEDDE